MLKFLRLMFLSLFFSRSQVQHIKKSTHGSTYGFILNKSLTPMPSLCLFLSCTSFSLVHVMCTRSGVAPAALSFAEWDAVFRSWISWAWAEDGGRRQFEFSKMHVVMQICHYFAVMRNMNIWAEEDVKTNNDVDEVVFRWWWWQHMQENTQWTQ